MLCLACCCVKVEQCTEPPDKKDEVASCVFITDVTFDMSYSFQMVSELLGMECLIGS